MKNPFTLSLDCLCQITIWLDNKGQIIDFDEVCKCGEMLAFSDLQKIYDSLPEGDR